MRGITRTRDPGYDLDRHHVEFADGTYRDVIGTRAFCSPEEGAHLYPEFEPGDSVHHPKFGYGTVVATNLSPEPGARLEHMIDFDRGMGRRLIVALPGGLRSARGLDRERRLGVSPPATGSASRMSPAERRERFDHRHDTPAYIQAMQGSARFDLYRQWLYRHVARPGSAFFDRLDPADSPAVWRFMERRYLDRYALLLKVCSVPSSAGLWPIDYPGGALRTGRGVKFEDYGIPASVVDALEQWSCFKEDVEFDHAHDGGPRPDFDALDRRGLALAGEVKRYAGADVYVEFRSFREVLWVDGDVVEAPMPEMIARCSSQHDAMS
ncbi:hypothetical protein [Salinisphaera japonica]|uniref:hypothetical protein n=1 Tax=Salinisphaera japonica TaxID=1304270 RepID=UPI000F4BB674|nr:hypothetical protein [Salinisphaera japonica]